MDIKPENLAQIASGNKKRFRKLFAQLKKMDKRLLDKKFHQLHEEAFAEIDCLECANCCKRISPMLTDTDMARLAQAENCKPGELSERYFHLDEDGDYVFTGQPCPFLMEDLHCQHYAQRPRACRLYPHTNQPRMHRALAVTSKNLSICPAVCYIALRLCKELGV